MFDEFIKNKKAEVGNMFKLVMGVFIVSILVGALIPSAINSITAGRNASWTAGVLSTYDALPILLVVAIVAVLAGIAYSAFSD